jgi:hypothetical protein
METRRHFGFRVLGWRRVSGRDRPLFTVKNNFETVANGPASDL